MIVENRPGAGGTLGARDVVNAAPDGYTLTVAQTPEIAINPYFMKDAGYDPLKDLQPIALAGVVPLALVVPAKAPYSTMAEFVKFLRSRQAAHLRFRRRRHARPSRRRIAETQAQQQADPRAL